MGTIRLDDEDAEGIRKVGMAVKRGAVIVYPTDTVYGIGGNPFDAGAVRRIMAIKRRGEKPMPVLVSGIEGALALIEAGALAKVLMQRLWPGALTIVAKRAACAPRSPAFGRGTVGVRMPNHGLALKIIEAAGGAVIGTSANISGRRAASPSASSTGDSRRRTWPSCWMALGAPLFGGRGQHGGRRGVVGVAEGRRHKRRGY